MFLEKIVTAKRKRLGLEQKEEDKVKALRNYQYHKKTSERLFYEAIRKDGLSLIGEIKRGSPSLGIINDSFILKDRVQVYDQVMDAMSILTEEDFFFGSAADLVQARAYTKKPILMKDFIINSTQIYKAKQIGADCILLIASILNTQQLQEYYMLARSLGLDVIMEVHNQEELEKALQTDADIIGINNRDLVSFAIDLDTTKHLAALIPEHILIVSESGIRSAEDVQRITNQSRVDAILVGESFMRTPNKIGRAHV